MKSTKKLISITDVLSALADAKSLSLFNNIGTQPEAAPIAITKLALSRKQFYSNLKRLFNAGLLQKSYGKYSLTSFGKLVYDSQRMIEKAIEIHWKLAAIDSLRIAGELPIEECHRITDILIEDQKIKDKILPQGSIVNNVDTTKHPKHTLLQEIPEPATSFVS